MDEQASNLIAVLKDLNRHELITELNKMKDDDHNCNITHSFLEKYFRSKNTYVSPNIYYEEAVNIVKIFPQYSVEYIKSMLEALQSESNRIIVILRLLLKDELSHNKKIVRPNPSVPDEASPQKKQKITPTCAAASSSSTDFENTAVQRNVMTSQNTSSLNEPSPSCDSRLVSNIMEMFPDALPAHIEQLCNGRSGSDFDYEFVVNNMLSNSYPRRRASNSTCNTDLVPNPLNSRNNPPNETHPQVTRLSDQAKQYTTEFNVDNFLDVISDPETYFNNPNKQSSLRVNGTLDESSVRYATVFLRNKYPSVNAGVIDHLLATHKYRLTPTAKELHNITENKINLIKNKREHAALSHSSVQHNIPLLQEVAYIDRKDFILNAKHCRENGLPLY